MSYEVLGQIIAEETGDKLPDLQVLAILEDDTEKILGEITTDPEGSFKIEYSPDIFQEFYSYEEPGLYLEIYNQKGALIYTTDQRLKPPEKSQFDIKLSKDLLDREPEPFAFDDDDEFAEDVKEDSE